MALISRNTRSHFQNPLPLPSAQISKKLSKYQTINNPKNELQAATFSKIKTIFTEATTKPLKDGPRLDKRLIEVLNKKGLKPIGFCGKGTFGSVYKVQNLATRSIYALKVPSRTECEALSNLQIEKDHYQNTIPNLPVKAQHAPKLIDTLPFTPSKAKGDSINKKFEALLLSFYPMDLETLLESLSKSKTYLPIALVQRLMNQLLAFNTALEQKGLHHNDLKTGNLLTDCNFNQDLDIKICDLSSLGTSNQLANSYDYQTISHRSPRTLLKTSTKIDIFSAGVILFELLTNKKPFDLWGKTKGGHNSNVEKAMRLHMQDVFQKIKAPSQGFIKKIPQEYQGVFFTKKGPKGSYVFKEKITSNPSWIREHIRKARPSDDKEVLESLVTLIQKMLDYERPPTFDTITKDLFFKKNFRIPV